MKPSTLIESQTITTPWKEYQEGGQRYRIRATIRWDDECGNGHNTLSITGETQRRECSHWVPDSCGCLHTEIAAHFPEYAHLIPFHLCSSDGPMHYIANTVYHADGHGPDAAWIYCDMPADPLGLMVGCGPRSIYTLDASQARLAETTPGYKVEWDEKTAKERRLDYARARAVWPDATDEELTQSKEALTAALNARLPALLERLREAVVSVGFIW